MLASLSHLLKVIYSLPSATKITVGCHLHSLSLPLQLYFLLLHSHPGSGFQTLWFLSGVNVHAQFFLRALSCRINAYGSFGPELIVIS